jgi:hypothetical protein
MLKINKLQTLGMIVLILAALFATISAIRPSAATGDELDSATRSYIARGMAMIAKRQAGQDLSLPPKPDFSHLNDKAIVPVTGSAEGLAVYHSGGWGGPVAVQNGLDIYHQSERVQAILANRYEAGLTQYYLSERGTFVAAQNGLDIYHQSERSDPLKVFISH